MFMVGDVKQSIYRWRGGDWTLLDRGVKNQFPGADDTTNLRENWRSLPEIVNFNNKFFDFAARALDGKMGGSLVQDIYAGAVQTPCAPEDAPGYVKCTFCESGKRNSRSCWSQSVRPARPEQATVR